ncbi:uncharacterized protein LOC114521510 [Dendronephthya gigantea]|uniref:uncharacterized protein LOC114521510 n=1 Tax=Dendronephthya gigantea TaxID=151771 RepID=UPI00106D4EA1|nr:uncharacterized protein LOC114521510 [Dendronephthya gigantea]
MLGYVNIIFAITIATGTACTHSHSRSSNDGENVMKSQTRNHIEKPSYDLEEHSANNYHELKNIKDNYHKLKHSNKYHQLKHTKNNFHRSKHTKGIQQKRLKNNSHHTKLSNNTDEEMENEVNETKHEKINIKFPDTYHATGLLTLPYDGIMEPFEIWYAGELNMSRIDYYHGVDKTFQRGDMEEYGIYIKEIPMHKTKVGHNKNNTKSCWYESGDEYDVVRPQSIVPMDLSHFKFVKEEYRSGTLTIKLKRHVKTGNLKNTYTLWVSKEKPHRPIRYETEGFDLLLRGYYDHYYLDYITFNDWYFDYMIMEIPEGSWCHEAAKQARSSIL